MQNIRSLPFFRRARNTAPEAATGSGAGTRTFSATAERVPALPAFRDERDVFLHFKLCTAVIVLALLCVALFGGLVAVAMRKPTVVLIDNTTGKSVVVDNVEQGRTPAAELARERIGAREKETAVKTFLDLLYRVDPNKEVRLQDVTRALAMMHPYSAGKLAALMDQQQTVTTQLRESQQSIWVVKSYELDKRDPYLATVLADQTVTRTPAGALQPETTTRQCVVKIKLRPDSEGRRSENANTGMQIIAYDFKVLPSTATPQSAIEGYNMTPAAVPGDVRIEPPPAAALAPATQLQTPQSR